MRGSMILPYRVSTQCSVVSTDEHPATTRAAASSANELRIFSYLDLNVRAGGRPSGARSAFARAPGMDDWPRVQSLARSRRTRMGFGAPARRSAALAAH